MLETWNSGLLWLQLAPMVGHEGSPTSGYQTAFPAPKLWHLVLAYSIDPCPTLAVSPPLAMMCKLGSYIPFSSSTPNHYKHLLIPNPLGLHNSIIALFVLDANFEQGRTQLLYAKPWPHIPGLPIVVVYLLSVSFFMIILEKIQLHPSSSER